MRARALILLRWPFWALLLLFSVVIHAVIAARVGSDLEAGIETSRRAAQDASRSREVVVEVEPAVPEEDVLEKPASDQPLTFEEAFELDPPEILVAPQAVVPPPQVALALTAQAGGSAEPAPPAPPTPAADAAHAAAVRASVVDLLAPGAAHSTSDGAGGGTAGFGVGIGNALGGSSNRFAAYIQELREAGLDVLFVIDATGSMGWVIDEVKTRVMDIAATVRSLVPVARFGIVAYRDEEDPEFVTKLQPLTYSTFKLQRFLAALTAQGGGGIYEAVYAGVKAGVESADWRSGARKILILVGDGPPAPRDLPHVLREVERFAASGGVVSTLDVSDLSNPAVIEARVGRKVNRALYRTEAMVQFQQIADAGNGDAATLEGEVSLSRRLIRLIIGDRYAREMQALLELI